MSQSSSIRDVIFHNGMTTFWLIADDGRAANDAVAEAASVEGPFERYINVRLVAGRIELTSEGPYFHRDPEGDVECWEVEAQ